MSAPMPTAREAARSAGTRRVVLTLADMACSPAADTRRAIDMLTDIVLPACEDDAARAYVRDIADEAKQMCAEGTQL